MGEGGLCSLLHLQFSEIILPDLLNLLDDIINILQSRVSTVLGISV
jgi:hypothetical protein